MASISSIIVSILHRDEDAAHYFQRAKYFKVRAIESRAEAIESEEFELLAFSRRHNEAYKRNMRKALERVTFLTGIDEATVKEVMAQYAMKVVSDALIDSVTL